MNCGDSSAPKRFAISSNPRSISTSSFPSRFVVKPNHSSGRIQVVLDKRAANWKDIWRICDDWLQTDYYRVNREWQYKNIPRKIICEEYLGDANGAISDYKIHCFDGKPKWISVISGGLSGQKTISRYDENWLPVGRDDSLISRDEPRPKRLNQLFSVAKLFSEGFDYIRVDLYIKDDRILLGELTSTPRAGIGLESGEMLERLGGLWQLDISNKTIFN